MSEYNPKETKPKAPDGYIVISIAKRTPEAGEYFLDDDGTVHLYSAAHLYPPRWIVTPQPPMSNIEVARALYGNTRTITLPDPDDGYKWSDEPKLPAAGQKYLISSTGEVKTSFSDYQATRFFVQEPIRKLYDFSKTGPNVLVFSRELFLVTTVSAGNPKELCKDIWQAHIGGDPCPVDPDATMVEVRTSYGNAESFACQVDWSIDRIYKVTRLVWGYEYP